MAQRRNTAKKAPARPQAPKPAPAPAAETTTSPVLDADLATIALADPAADLEAIKSGLVGETEALRPADDGLTTEPAGHTGGGQPDLTGAEPAPGTAPATIEPQRYEDPAAAPAPDAEEKPEEKPEKAKPSKVKAKHYVVGSAAPETLYEVDGKVVRSLKPGQSGRFLAREGAGLSERAAAHLNGN